MLKKYLFVSLLLTFANFFIQPAQADTESWNWFEFRFPLLRNNDFGLPKTDFRFFSDTRINGRSSGLSESFVRVGPLIHFTPWLFVGIHGTIVSNRVSDGLFQQEIRAEFEPNFHWRFGDFTLNDRNRLEYRYRDVWTKWRYRNQLRINYAPTGTKVIPYVWDEVLVDLSGEGFNQNRLSLGLGYQFSNELRVDAGYLLRSRNVNSQWTNDHILLLSLFFDKKDF